MKADFEPWWMFDDWEEKIVSRQAFDDLVQAKAYLNSILNEFRSRYDNERLEKECYIAFWSDTEKSFCEACEDDAQIYHGVILLFDGKPHSIKI